MKYVLLLFLIVFISCSEIEKPNRSRDCFVHSIIKPAVEKVDEEIPLIYTKFRPHSAIGDFDGDANSEVLVEYFFDPKTKCRIDSIPQERNYEWLFNRSTLTWLTCADTNISSLKLYGEDNFGILYLIALPDIDQDSTDEIAVVMNHADFSSMNSCHIYEFQNGVWHLTFSFSILETLPTNEEASAQSIPGFLEYHDYKWYYSDYSKQEEFLLIEGPVPQMKPLKW